MQDFVSGLSRHGLRWRTPRTNEPDPPDCVCINESGDLVGIEVVEFVSREAVERNNLGEDVWCRWVPEDIERQISSLLSGKDQKTFHGGPYSEIAVLMHTVSLC